MASPITVNTGKLKDARSIKRRFRSKSLRFYNGRASSNVTRNGRVTLRVNSMKAILMNNGNMNSTNISDKDSVVAEDILQILGISCVKDYAINRPDYSFLPEQTDIETIDNPNKPDWKIYKYLPKGKTDFSKILKNPENSFFKLDEGIDQPTINEVKILKNQKKMSYNFDEIVANIYHVNYGMPNTKNLRSLRKK